MNFPTEFQNKTESLPIDSMGDTAISAASILAEKGYEVRLGLTEQLAEEVVAMALEPAIREYCPNDSGDRFKNVERAKEWLQKGKAVFLLFQRSESGELKLAGYGWAGASVSDQVPDGEVSFAVRIGEIGKGQGLATPFVRLILCAASALFDARNIWLEAWQSNAGAVHVYHKVGFVDVAQRDGKRPSLNGEVDDVRLYMSLPGELLPDRNAAALSSDS